MATEQDTIFAPATAGGRAGVAVIRISGPRAAETLARLSGRTVWVPRRATGVPLRGSGGEVLDRGLALWFPAPASFTGEDVAELHVHGGRAVVAAVLGALGEIEGLRPAEPGEFTRRAYENDKLDLTQAEALADLVAAETAEQRRQALAQLDGALGKLYESWRDRLLRATAHLEATIDFADEDLPAGLAEASRSEVEAVRREVLAHLADGRRGERIRDGVSIVLVGPPNAGKSSLRNALARREAAIVDAAPGTTRDIIEVAMDLSGFRVLLADTAGLREAEGRVEREGVRRSRARAEEADIRIAVFDGGLWPSFDQRTAELLDGSTVVILNKGDLEHVPGRARIDGREAIITSALTGAGIPTLLSALTERVAEACGGGDGPALTRIRHRRHLQSCCDALGRFSLAEGSETLAEELRMAVSALGRITGRVDVEDVLGTIFQEFCIGK
jgi:tRNA modification GTPase